MAAKNVSEKTVATKLVAHLDLFSLVDDISKRFRCQVVVHLSWKDVLVSVKDVALLPVNGATVVDDRVENIPI